LSKSNKKSQESKPASSFKISELVKIIINVISLFIEKPIKDWLMDTDSRLLYGIKFGKSKGYFKTGDAVIVVTGWKKGSGFTNTMRVFYVPESNHFV
jgi:pyruvate kinase